MAAKEVVYVRVSPEVKASLDKIVELGARAWPRLTLQGVVEGFIREGIERVHARAVEESKTNKGNRVVRGPQLALKRAGKKASR